MSTNIIKDLGNRIENVVIQQTSDAKREANRGALAMVFVVFFFLVIFVGLLIGYVREFEISGYKDMLTAVSSILSGPLGFIIGFYFKERQSPGGSTNTSGDT